MSRHCVHLPPRPSIRIFVLLAMLIATAQHQADSSPPLVTGSFKGIVTTIRTGKPINSADITINPSGLKTSTDTAGRFSYESIPAGLYSLTISATGFDTLIVPTVQIRAKKNVMHEFMLIESEQVPSLEKIVIRAGSSVRSAASSNSVTHLGTYEMNNTPAAFNDINRIIASTPSAVLQGSSDYMNGVIVRGGDPSENVYQLDGFELENPNHFAYGQSSMGAIGFINTSLVQCLDFYAGAFPAEMSPGLSSVTSIKFRRGSLTDRKHQVDLSLLGLGLTTEGPFLQSKGSYLISGRMVNSRFLRFFIPGLPIMPSWEDFLIKTTLQINKDNELNFIATGAGDQMRAHLLDNELMCNLDGGLFYTQSLCGFAWRLAKTTFVNNVSLSGRSFRSREYWDLDKAGRERWRFTNLWDRDWRRYNLQLKDQFTFFIGDDQLDAGISAENIWYRRFNRDDVSDHPRFMKTAADSVYLKWAKDTLHHVGDTIDRLAGYIDQPLNGYYNLGEHFGGFVEYMRVFHPVKVITGVRNDYYTLLHKNGLSPRLAVVVDPEKIGRLSLSGGLYQQFPSYLNNIITDSAFIPLISKYSLQRCWEGSAGYERLLGSFHLVRAEAYLKWYDREFIYSTPEGPDLDSVQYNGAQNGKRKIVGCEFQFKKRSFDKFYYALAYSLAISENQYTNGIWYDDKNSFRNVGSLLLGTNFFKRHGLALHLIAREGQPYSDLEMIKSDMVRPDGKTLTTYHASYPDRSKWNSKRRDPYVTLGIRYDFKIYRKWGNFTGYIDVSNILDNTPVVDEIVNPETGKIERNTAAGILPMFGLTVDF